MTSIAEIRAQFSAKTKRAPRNHLSELWIGVPKGGRTGVDQEFFSMAGFAIADQVKRVDDYRLTDGPDFAQIGIRLNEMKPQQALALVGVGKLDAAIVGRDVLKEYNLDVGKRGKKGIAQSVELVDLDLAPCALMIAVDENDPAKTASDMEGRVIATKYPNLLQKWAKANRVQLGDIVSMITDDDAILGGIEAYSQFDPRINAICDMVQSGESLVRYELKPLGIREDDWGNVMADVLGDVPEKARRRFDTLPSDAIASAGQVLASSAVLVRTARKLNPEKEATLAKLTERFYQASLSLGRTPVIKQKRVGEQSARSKKPEIVRIPVENYGPHSVWAQP